MEREYIKDNCNRILGWRIEFGNRIAGFDKNGYLRGFYDPFFKTTSDNCNRVIGRGDMLTSLILNIKAF